MAVEPLKAHQLTTIEHNNKLASEHDNHKSVHMLNKFAAIVCIVDVSAIRFDVLSSSSGVEFLFFISFRYEQDDDNTNWMANDILDNFLGAMKHTIFYTLYLFVMTINTEKRKKKMIRIIF